jgi:hypothetical protein
VDLAIFQYFGSKVQKLGGITGQLTHGSHLWIFFKYISDISNTTIWEWMAVFTQKIHLWDIFMDIFWM